ncbi:MAG: dadX [Rickettsiaceae bacterium]|jgi:alanine racemase|nr:dadX [Rickettsiaceae bacterium]
MKNKFSDTKLSINLSAIKSNYKLLKKHGKVAAVVKANAYGLGVGEVSSSLYEAGCREFFVANLDEALELRKILPDVFIAVFQGAQEGQGKYFEKHDLVPVINTVHQVKLWQQYSEKQGSKLSCIVHFDTGMNRLGLSMKDAGLVAKFKIKYIMSHLACADTPKHPKNAEQLKNMKAIAKLFPKVPVSFANSSGVFLGEDYLFDRIRAGIAIYGGNPTPYTKNPMKNVVTLTSKILQVRVIDSVDSVGYGATHNVPAGAKIATIPVGYADGYSRHLSNRGYCAIDGKKVPVIGRVSMDLITIDVSSIESGKLVVGQEVELIGNTITIDDVASWSGTISYEVLTSLGCRHLREYL